MTVLQHFQAPERLSKYSATRRIWSLLRKLRKLEFLTCLLERGYPRELAENILAKVKFSSRNKVLQNKSKTSRNTLPFVTTFNPATPNLKKVLMKHWHLITESNRLGEIYLGNNNNNFCRSAYRRLSYLQLSCQGLLLYAIDA